MGVEGQPTLQGSSHAIAQPHLVVLGAGITLESHCLLTHIGPLMDHFLRIWFLLVSYFQSCVCSMCSLNVDWKLKHLLVKVVGRYFLFPFAVSRWRFAEFQYLQSGPPRRLQTVVVYLPDVWTVMPTLEEWEALCQQKAAEAAPPPREACGVRLSLADQWAERVP